MNETNQIIICIGMALSSLIIAHYFLIKPAFSEREVGSSTELTTSELLARHIKVLISIRLVGRAVYRIVALHTAAVIALIITGYLKDNHQYVPAIIVSLIFILGGWYLSSRISAAYLSGLTLIEKFDVDGAVEAELDAQIKARKFNNVDK